MLTHLVFIVPWRVQNTNVYAARVDACATRRQDGPLEYLLVGALTLEDFSRIFDQHGIELGLRYAGAEQGRDHIVVNMEIVPAREDRGELALREPMIEARGVVREHHLLGVTLLA